MATIKDVSHVSGISIGTVSRYLNGHQFKKENEKKIQEAIRQLDYKINQTARGLKTNKKYTIGVLVPSITVFSLIRHRNLEVLPVSFQKSETMHSEN